MKGLLSLLFPPKCPICGALAESADGFCPVCEDGLPKITGPRCSICAAPMGGEFAMPNCADCRGGVPYEKCFVPFSYRDGVRRAILNMKFYSRPAAFRCFARAIADEMGGFRPDCITYVPQSRKAGRERGYNHARLIACELGRLLDVPVRRVLRRIEGGEDQVGLSRSRRLTNARRLYHPAAKKRLSGTWLVVDDVITTGATMKWCCTLLRRMGCGSVYGAAVARAGLGYSGTDINKTPFPSVETAFTEGLLTPR